jgi:hypothetical protein
VKSQDLEEIKFVLYHLISQCGVEEIICLRGALHPRMDITPIIMNA